MMRSLFSGVSGLKNHQTRMDVIGNNISNVNTTGFKSSRVNFTDMLSQNLQGASSPQDNLGGTNPKQIGLGSAVGAVDLLFTNGSVQSTGVNTDLALSSTNALFILDTGHGTSYTRNGDFQFDAEGNYVQAGNGYFVQGWMADENGTIDTGKGVTQITIPSGKTMAPTASTQAAYTNNLNAEVPTIVKISGGKVIKAEPTIYTKETDGSMTASTEYPIKITTGEGDGPFTVSKPESYTVGNSFTIGEGCEITTGTMAGSPTYPVKITAGGNTFRRDSGSYTIPGKFSTNIVGNEMNATSEKPVTVTVGGNVLSPDKTDGSYRVGDAYSAANGETLTGTAPYPLTLVAGGTTFSPVTGSYTVGSDTYTTEDDGKSMTATGTANVKIVDNDGHETTVDSGTFTVGQPYGSSTIKSLTAVVTAASQTITELEADIVNLSREITKMEQDEPTEVDASPDDPATLTMSDGSKVTQTSGKYILGHSLPIVTTLAVYDTLGSAHDLPVYFTMTNAAQDTWEVTLKTDGTNTASWKEADGSTTTVTMDPVTLDFTDTGRYDTGSGQPEIRVTNGAKTGYTISLDFTALTQYTSSSTIAGKADGNAAGTLSSVSIDKSGTITGTYTNGMKKTEAQVALQRFNNPGGLTKVGESLYEDSNNAGKSGEPNTASALGATITPAALEMSNVDIANEFTDMIITQRGFQGNSKIITVSDEMLETLINMKR